MSPVATKAAEFWGGACPTPKSNNSYTGNYTTSADASFGVSPALANFELNLRFNEDVGRLPAEDYFYSLGMIQGNQETDEQEAAMEKMVSLLGLDGTWHGEFSRLIDVEKAVDHALSLAPRLRARQKS